MDNRDRKSWKELKNKGGTFEDYQMHNIRSPVRKQVPAWATGRNTIEQYLAIKHHRAVDIAKKYWLEKRTAKEIARDRGETVSAIEQAIKRLRKL